LLTYAILTAELQARENKSEDYKKEKGKTNEAAGGFIGTNVLAYQYKSTCLLVQKYLLASAKVQILTQLCCRASSG
jgi:hypothetical protein